MKKFPPVLMLTSVSTVAVALSALASATSPEQAFLKELQHDQIPISDTSDAVSLAYNVCDMLTNGTSPASAKHRITESAPDLEGVSASIFLDAAVTYLCPQEQDLPSLGLPPDMQHGYS